MNKKLFWNVFFGAAALFAGCSDDELVVDSKYPISNTEDIAIGGTGDFGQSKSSRTIYTGQDDGTCEYINWILGQETPGWDSDEILIYSPQAKTPEGSDTASYRLFAHTGKNAEIYTSLKTKWPKASADNSVNPAGFDNGSFAVSGSPAGLRWENQTPSTAHEFYAVYPSPNLNPSVKLSKQTTAGIVQFEGTISSFQHVAGYIVDPKPNDKSKKSYIAMPSMRECFMYAVHQATDAEVKANSINLNFKTLPTVLEVDLVWPDNTEASEYTLQNVMLTSTSQELAGPFTADLHLNDTVQNVKLVDDGNVQKSVIVDLDSDFNDGVAGVTLQGGDHLKVRFLLAPQQLNTADMKITVVGTQKKGGALIKSMKSHSIKVPAKFNLVPHKLNKIKNIKLPVFSEGSSNNWLSLMDDNILLSQLSIPGTGNSYVNPDFTTDWKGYERAQVLSVEKQWNMGVRCFEVSLDNKTPFGNQKIRIDNTTETDVTFEALLTQLQGFLGEGQPSEREFAMVIVRYQPSKVRNPQIFVTNFESFFGGLTKNNPTKYCQFKPGLTIGEVRGKIMILLCPTSEGEDDLTNITSTNNNYLLINGCGSLPDKFYKRHYVYGNNKKNLVSPWIANMGKVSVEQTAEYYLTPGLIDQLSCIPESADFTYETNAGFDVWYQEWTRVIEETSTKKKIVYGESVHKDATAPTKYAWRSSYNEKLKHAKTTFKKAVGNTNQDKVYINSLCGYLVGPTTVESPSPLYQPLINAQWPALKGNIEALSDKLNLDFYKYMHGELSKGQVKGPMGVVLMNRVGEVIETNGVVNNGPLLMPNMVIMNNFSFPLSTKKSNKSASRALNCSSNGDGVVIDAQGWKW